MPMMIMGKAKTGSCTETRMRIHGQPGAPALVMVNTKYTYWTTPTLPSEKDRQPKSVGRNGVATTATCLQSPGMSL